MRKYDLDLNARCPEDHDYGCMPNVALTEFKEAAIQYIAGYVSAMVEKQVHFGVPRVHHFWSKF